MPRVKTWSVVLVIVTMIYLLITSINLSSYSDYNLNSTSTSTPPHISSTSITNKHSETNTINNNNNNIGNGGNGNSNGNVIIDDKNNNNDDGKYKPNEYNTVTNINNNDDNNNNNNNNNNDNGGATINNINDGGGINNDDDDDDNGGAINNNEDDDKGINNTNEDDGGIEEEEEEEEEEGGGINNDDNNNVLTHPINNTNIINTDNNNNNNNNTSITNNNNTIANNTVPPINTNTTNNDNTTTTTIDNSNNNKNETVYLFIGILASYTKADRRKAIRETWTNYPQFKNWTYKFCLGNTEDKVARADAEKENAQYGDIIFSPYVDNYRNITWKVLYMAQYATENYNFDYFFKTDDDSYLVIDRLVEASHNYSKTGFYGGVRTIYEPRRDPKDPSYMPYELYPHATGPPMLKGAGYLLSHDSTFVLADMLTHPKPHLPILPLEDVNSAIVMNFYNISAVNIPQFMPTTAICACREDMILSHWCSPDAMRSLTNNFLNKGGKFC